MRKLTTFLCLLILVSSGFAQQNVEIFGYYESQLMGAELNNDFYQLYTNKLRVDLQGEIADNVSFGANFDYITYHGKKQWNILNFLAPEVVNSIPEQQRQLYTLPFENRQFLDNAYLQIAFDWADFTAGKQQISLGTGYVWNPIDIFNVKDVLDPTYEQPGHNALRLDIPIKMRSTLTTIYTPQDSWNNSTKLIQFKTGLSRFDFTFTAIEKERITHDYSQFIPARQNFLELSEKRQLLGVSTVGELLGLGVYSEYAYNIMEASDDFYEFVVGANYTFEFQTYVMLEFYRSQLGRTNYHDYTITDWMQQYTQEKKTIARDQLYLMVDHPLTDYINFGLTGIHCLSDNSFSLVPTLEYSFTQNTQITMYLNRNFGKQGTMYARDSGSGGMIRARVYF